MKIKSFQIHPYQLPLKKPLAAKGASTLTREGFWLEVQSANGEIAFGEAAPLVWDKYELAQVEKELYRAGEFLKQKDIPVDAQAALPFLEKVMFPEKLPSVCRFAWEMALVQLCAGHQKRDLRSFLNGRGKGSHVVQVNGLVSGKEEAALEQAAELIRVGYRSLKVKVGSNIEKDISLARALRELLPEEGTLRFDTNGQWAFKDALAFAREVGNEKVDYIEEPFALPHSFSESLASYNEFYGETSMSFALDESLSTCCWEDLDSLAGLKALVLKPSCLGLRESLEFIKAAQERGLRAVISSSFESSLGLSFLALLAASTFQPEVAMGLGTFAWFSGDILLPAFHVTAGIIDAERLSLIHVPGTGTTVPVPGTDSFTGKNA